MKVSFARMYLCFLWVLWQGVATGVGHQPLSFQILAALDVELRPVAVLASRRDALCQPAVWQLLDGRVYPPEAERLQNHLDIRQRPRHCRLPPIARHPTFPLPPVVLLQPPAQPRPVVERLQIPYFHNPYIKHLHINELANKRIHTFITRVLRLLIVSSLPSNYRGKITGS